MSLRDAYACFQKIILHPPLKTPFWRRLFLTKETTRYAKALATEIAQLDASPDDKRAMTILGEALFEIENAPLPAEFDKISDNKPSLFVVLRPGQTSEMVARGVIALTTFSGLSVSLYSSFGEVRTPVTIEPDLKAEGIQARLEGAHPLRSLFQHMGSGPKD